MMNMEIASFRPVNTFINTDTIEGKATIRVTKDPKVKAVDEATFARLVASDFRNGLIEVKVLSKLLENAPDLRVGLLALPSELMRVIQSSSVFISARPMEEPKTSCEEIDLHNISHIRILSLTVSGMNSLAYMNHTRIWALTSGSL